MDQELAGRQAKLRQSENEFYEATNLTQQEIGQAKQITKEYEAMRQARDDALALANRWLMFIYGLTIAVGILLIVDWKKRKDRERGLRAIEGLREALDQHMTPDQRNAIVAAVAKVAGRLPAP